MKTAKLIRNSTSNHPGKEPLPPKVTEGFFFQLPTPGESFVLMTESSSVRGEVNRTVTSKVQTIKVSLQDNTSTVEFKTVNSSYTLVVFSDLKG